MQGEIIIIPQALLVLCQSRTMRPMLVQLLQDLLDLGEHLGHDDRVQGVRGPQEKVHELQDGEG